MKTHHGMTRSNGIGGRVLTVALGALAIGCASPALAATATWTNTSNGAVGYWANNANWNASSYPGSGASEIAYFTTATAATYTAILNTTLLNGLGQLQVKNTQGMARVMVDNAALSVTNGILYLQGGGWLQIDHGGAVTNSHGSTPIYWNWGQAGNGSSTLCLTNGGALVTIGGGNAYVGGGMATNTALLYGNGVWSVNPQLFIGNGTSTMQVAGNGTWNIAGGLIVSSGTSFNTLSISDGCAVNFGAGNSILVGYTSGSGFNSMTLSNATVSGLMTGATKLGYGGFSNSITIGPGGVWSLPGSGFLVGAANGSQTSTGNLLSVNNGIMTNLSLTVGNSLNCNGNTATFSNGATMYCGGNLIVGNVANGNTLNLGGLGAPVVVTAVTSSSSNLYIGASGAAFNVMNISNATLVTPAGGLYIGTSASSNTVNVFSGGVWDLQGNTLYDGFATATGNVLWVDHGGLVTNVNKLYVGYYYPNPGATVNNSLTITNGGTLVSTGAVGIGYCKLAVSNTATVCGGLSGNALWNLGGASLTIGALAGTTGNTVTVSSGGLVTNVGTLFVGNNASAYGNNVALSGGTLCVSNLTMNTGVSNVLYFSSGLLSLQIASVNNGLPVIVGDGASGAELNLTGGTNQTLTFANGLVITNAASLTGSGKIAATTTVYGVLSPGGATNVGAIVFTTSLTLAPSATLQVDLNGTGSGQCDFISAPSQTVNLNGARLTVNLSNYTPGRGDVFTNLIAGSVTGSFGNLLGGRVSSADRRKGSLAVSTSGGKVILSNYIPPSGGTIVLIL